MNGYITLPLDKLSPVSFLWDRPATVNIMELESDPEDMRIYYCSFIYIFWPPGGVLNGSVSVGLPFGHDRDVRLLYLLC